MREITEGIGNTGIKAGIIKTATGGIPGMTETATSIGKHEETCLRGRGPHAQGHRDTHSVP